MKNRFQIVSGLIVVFLIIFLGFVIFGDQGAVDLYKRMNERDLMVQNNIKLEQENILLYRILHRLKHDPVYIENIARSELGMIGRNEIIYKFKD